MFLFVLLLHAQQIRLFLKSLLFLIEVLLQLPYLGIHLFVRVQLLIKSDLKFFDLLVKIDNLLELVLLEHKHLIGGVGESFFLFLVIVDDESHILDLLGFLLEIDFGIIESACDNVGLFLGSSRFIFDEIEFLAKNSVFELHFVEHLLHLIHLFERFLSLVLVLLKIALKLINLLFESLNVIVVCLDDGTFLFLSLVFPSFDLLFHFLNSTLLLND
mmetsp:Transcript_4923/g.18529  ORF Transcript_4923/g.18529 Transcript_4923/m.18529 type:complete len:216 (-) Transcript_4923:704-1351(-)